MAEHREPNLDDDGSKSSFQKTVVLRDWWLVKCPKEFEGKRFGVAGIEDSVETRAMRAFTSSPIIKALDVFTLLASDGIYITLRGFFNKERVVKNGFLPEISRQFIFGFPPCWERICNNCFGGDSFGIDNNTVSSKIEKACSPFLSPCKNMNGILEDNPAESRDKSTVTNTNMAEVNKKDGSRARNKKTARTNSLYLQSKSGGKIQEDERKLESSKADGDHGSEDLNKAKCGDVEKDECEAINNEDNERKFDESEVQDRTNDGDHGSEGLDKAKSSDVEKDLCKAIHSNVISPCIGCGIKHTNAGNVDKVTSASATGESVTSEQRKGLLKVTTASPHSLLKDLEKSSNPGKKGKKGKTDGNVVEPMNYSGTKVKRAENKRKLSVCKLQNLITNDRDHGSEGLDKAKSIDVEKDECEAIDNGVILPADGCGRNHTGAHNVDKVTNTSITGESMTSEQRKVELNVTTASPHSLLKDLGKGSKPAKKGTSKKSAKTLKSDDNVVDPINYSGTKVRTAENKWKLCVSKLQNPTTNDGDHGKEGLNKDKSSDIEKDECVAINSEVISPVDECGKRLSGAYSVERVASKNATKESLTSEQRKGRVKVTKTFRDPLWKDSENSRKPGKKGKSKKSEKTLKRDWNVVEPHLGSEADENLSWEKIKRKIDFDVEVTPDKNVKKQKTSAVSTDSLGQKRSRSGRVLVSSLEFWRNQIPVYDVDRNLIKVKEGHETNSTPSKGKGSVSRKPRR